MVAASSILAMHDAFSVNPRLHNDMVHIDARSDDCFEEGVKQIEAFVGKRGFFDIGAWRLHKHFDLEPDEILLTTFDRVPDKVEVSVGKADSVQDKIMPMCLKYDARVRKWVPLQFLVLRGGADAVHRLQERAAWLENAHVQEGLGQLGQALEELSLSDSVGISMKALDVAMTAWTGLVERTSVAKRVQAFTPARDDEKQNQYIVTHVFFEGRPKTSACQYECVQRCEIACYEVEDSNGGFHHQNTHDMSIHDNNHAPTPEEQDRVG